VLPVGPPDGETRAAIWTRYTDEITDEEIGVDDLVEASEMFTPADIEFAARKAAQRAFEREHFEGATHRARTEDFRRAIQQVRPTLTPEMLEAFESARRSHARY
jgi:transitional endoplasmic reticulum ATPase